MSIMVDMKKVYGNLIIFNLWKINEKEMLQPISHLITFSRYTVTKLDLIISKYVNIAQALVNLIYQVVG